MAQSLASILTRLVFSTKNRVPFLSGVIDSEIHPYLVGILKQTNCSPIQVGGTCDHVHLFFRLARTKSIAEIVETLKTSSSKWIKTKDRNLADFHWQSGCGAFSVSQSSSGQVVAYIRNQPEHHRKLSFQEEYRRFLDRSQVAYDERYGWD